MGGRGAAGGSSGVTWHVAHNDRREGTPCVTRSSNTQTCRCRYVQETCGAEGQATHRHGEEEVAEKVQPHPVRRPSSPGALTLPPSVRRPPPGPSLGPRRAPGGLPDRRAPPPQPPVPWATRGWGAGRGGWWPGGWLVGCPGRSPERMAWVSRLMLSMDGCPRQPPAGQACPTHRPAAHALLHRGSSRRACSPACFPRTPAPPHRPPPWPGGFAPSEPADPPREPVDLPLEPGPGRSLSPARRRRQRAPSSACRAGVQGQGSTVESHCLRV